ncbi:MULTISPECIES: Lmo0850 family protein [Jeotgalibacillus]|uniref:Uncharacterized protein n=2 Tax=Jeotgalibacillus TaxID=157226 RepID=A0A0B5APV6_9BACL|nr:MULTISPECIES: Lmo0850 family protein [Jeotgalibacillus]AJD90119.1 hypothetical protein JMA_08020 [Jeotgalibacillus malaysiensis]MDZ5713176.1 Lmo0850 family protein [Jeotgalibacillus sp. HH7-29]
MSRNREGIKELMTKMTEVGVKITTTKSRLEILEAVKEPHQVSGT